MAAYARPADLSEALAILASPRPPLILAGGTDYYPARVGKPLNDDLLDITAIPDLRGIQDAANHWRIGATVTWGEIAAAELPPLFDGLRQAAREVGGAQVQNAGTLAGNLCNASPAADGAPMLMAMDARLELQSKGGRREMPLAQFISGNRRTQLQPGELVTAILVPKPAYQGRSVFLKLGARRYLVISIAMVGVMLDVADGIVQQAGLAIGACSAAAKRLPELEQALVGHKLAPALAQRVLPEHFASLSPIDDIRADAAYRRYSAMILTRRAIAALAIQKT